MPLPYPPKRAAVLYVASQLPKLSETFVYRELFGLREQGRTMLAASVRPPDRFPDDPVLAALADEAVIAYSPATWRQAPLAIARHPAIALGALADAARADHPSLRSRLKHVVQAIAGIALGHRLRGRGIGHVHGHMAHVPATIALYAARTLGARFSFTGHAADLFVDRAALRFKLEQADFVACISHWHQAFYREITPLPARRLPVVRCSVALPERIEASNREVVTVARLVPKKGIDLLIRAFARARPAGWTLRILGDGPERPALERLAAELGVDAIRFEGAQPHAVCLAAIRAAGLFVLPCRTAGNGDRDGIPVVLMEAMAAARGVIAGDLGAIRELIVDQLSGLLVPPDDADAIAAAMLELIADPARRERLGRAARERVREEFSDDTNLTRLGEALDMAGIEEHRP
jgi:colanic acid/amylovoran biosynthesis glycosyltransferase